VQEEGEADQRPVDRGRGAAQVEQVIAIVAHVLGGHVGGPAREAAAFQPGDEARHVARVLGDARGGEPGRARHALLPVRHFLP